MLALGLWLLAGRAAAVGDDYTVVNTTYGPLRGGVNGTTRYFRGIPYAAAPLGNRRWRPPSKHPVWTAERDATNFGASCLQHGGWKTINSTVQSEDCLFLNIYAPVPRAGAPKSYPVMVYFHAGEYRMGSSNDRENNWPYFSDTIVLVTINSRLGALGYLASDALRARSADNSTGNYGIQDQQFALRWVKDNIAAFGGDRDNVLIFGESSGGSSVGVHLTNPRSFGLFDKAILESPGLYQVKTFDNAVANHDFLISALAAEGSPGCRSLPGAYHEYPNRNIGHGRGAIGSSAGTSVSVARAKCDSDESCRAFEIRYDMNETIFYERSFPVYRSNYSIQAEVEPYETVFISAGDPSGAMECLLAANASTMISLTAWGIPFDDTTDVDGFGPVIDGVELKRSVVDSILAGAIAPRVPILLGSNLDEGTEFLGCAPRSPCNSTYDDFRTWCLRSFGEKFADSAASLYKNLTFPVPECKGYKDDGSVPEHRHLVENGNQDLPVPYYWHVAAQRASTDYTIGCPARKLAQQAARSEDKGKSRPVFRYFFTHRPKYSENMENIEVMGSFHGAEVPFVFGDAFELVTDEERELSAKMGCYWSNFAHTGNPNGECRGAKLPGWPAYDAEEKMIRFNTSGVEAFRNPLNTERCNLLDKVRQTLPPSAEQASASTRKGPAPPSPPAKGAWETGKYRNLFVESGLHTQDEVDARVSAVFEQLFFGDADNERLLYWENSTSAYIHSIDSNDVRTEGMSYGMMVAVQLNNQTLFDALWTWASTHMRHNDPSDPRYGYFSWHNQISGQPMDQNPASDGETWFATALFFAAARWNGNGAGKFDYVADANAILLAATTKNNTQSVVNMFNIDERQVVFVPYASSAKFTDPSYHLPTYYRVWQEKADVSTANVSSAFWGEMADVARKHLKSTTNEKTGLAPDYSKFDGSPTGGSHQQFRFDAWRVAANIATDYAWFGAEAGDWQVGWANRLHRFFAGQQGGINGYGNQYSLEGNELSKDHSPGLVAMNAVAALASDDALAWDFVEALWNTTTPTGKYRYYDGCLYMWGMLHVSGKFKAYL